MALLDQCSFAYSDPAQVIAGQVFSFAVAVPPLIPTTALLPPVLDTATAATIVWRVADTATLNPLAPGDDYQIVAGGLNQMDVSFVINPSRTAKFNVQPLLTIAGGAGAQVTSNVATGWAPITYTPVGSSPAELRAKAAKLLQAALQLITSANLVEPGASVTLKVVQAAMTQTPQIVTNLVHELPEVKIRGAIPLGAILEAIVGPIAGAISSALPSSTHSAAGEVGDVAKLLAEALAIPIAIDVGGRKVTRTLAPLTTDLATTVTSAPNDAQNLIGTVPMDGFLSNFNLSSGVAVTWSVSTLDGNPVENINLSPGLDLVRTLLLLPDIVGLELLPDTILPTPVQVTATLRFDLPQLNLTAANAVQVVLGPITLLRLPIILPQIAAVFRNALNDWTGDGGQRALLSTDSFGAKLMPSLDAMIRLLSALSSVLDTFTKAAVETGTAAVGAWGNFLGLGQGVRLLVTLLGRIPQSKIYFQPAYQPDPVDGVDRTNLTTDWDDKISAAIHIGCYAYYVDEKLGIQGKWFRLADTNGPDWLDFNNPNQVFSYTSIVSNLNVHYDTLKHSFPPHTADTNHPGSNLNDILERLEFRSSF